jgi:signal transduction histidine kinase
VTVALLLAGWLVAAGLAAALGLAARRARLRAELAARACHELRGPLTAAELALHGLGRRGLPIAPVQAELARARMALADLEAARDGRHGGQRREDVDVGALLARHEPAWAAAAAAAGARLELGRPPRHARTVVRGDGVRIAQAVANLVANAAEHAGGRVRVAVRATRGTVAIEVRDDGPGLPAPVAQLARRPRAGRGARGRGLAIVAGIAARHGGRLATAPAATGARLVLELPAASSRAARSPGRPAWAAAFEPAVPEASEPAGPAAPSAGVPEAG